MVSTRATCPICEFSIRIAVTISQLCLYCSQPRECLTHCHCTACSYVSPPTSSAAQTWGIGWYVKNTANSGFLNNTFVNWDARSQFGYTWGVPTPTADFHVDYNSYFTPGRPSTPFKAGSVTTLAEWQKECDCDAHSSISADIELSTVMTLAKQYLELAP
jgi:hypothetical protein